LYGKIPVLRKLFYPQSFTILSGRMVNGERSWHSPGGQRGQSHYFAQHSHGQSSATQPRQTILYDDHEPNYYNNHQTAAASLKRPSPTSKETPIKARKPIPSKVATTPDLQTTRLQQNSQSKIRPQTVTPIPSKVTTTATSKSHDSSKFRNQKSDLEQ
jgi:hypothetical protein